MPEEKRVHADRSGDSCFQSATPLDRTGTNRIMNVSMKKNLLTCSLSLLAALIWGSTALLADETDVEDQPLQGVRIVALVGEGFHPGETHQPMNYWMDRGAEVIVAGIETGTVSASFGPQTAEVTRLVDEVSLDEFDAVFIPGGTSPAKLREHESVLEFVRQAAAADKVMAAICHGPQVLITAGVLDGVTATCVVVEEREYFAVRDDLEAAGATYVNEPVVIDGQFITSRLLQDVPVFKAAVAEVLRERHGE